VAYEEDKVFKRYLKLRKSFI